MYIRHCYAAEMCSLSRLSIPIYLSIHPSICLCIYLSVFIYTICIGEVLGGKVFFPFLCRTENWWESREIGCQQATLMTGWCRPLGWVFGGGFFVDIPSMDLLRVSKYDPVLLLAILFTLKFFCSSQAWNVWLLPFLFETFLSFLSKRSIFLCRVAGTPSNVLQCAS